MMAHEEESGGGERTGCSYGYVQRKKIVAEAVYNQEVARWEIEKKSNKNGEWVNTVVEAGTMRDKVNGLVLLVQQSPFHRLTTLDQLLALAQSHTTRIAILAIESIKSLFFASYLPDTKLAFFGKHFETITEEEAEQVDMQQLVRWYYEDAVKGRYTAFIQCLESAAHSPLRESKSVAIGTLQKMLVEKPEQEHTILNLLVNKMGDPHAKTATWTTNLILGILEQHPQMKLVISKEVQLFINKHTPLTTTIPLLLLSHIVLARGETELANMLVSTYFRQLKVLSEQKVIKKAKGRKQKAKKQIEEIKENTDESSTGDSANDTKMVSVLLTGVNRAFPYSQLPQDVYESHLEILFTLVEQGGFNRKVLALVVIFKVIKLQQEISDNVDTLNRTRFYHLLYDLLLSPELSAGFGQPNYKQAFFSLVEGAIAADKDGARARALMKRLLVMSAHARPGFACSSILLAARLFKANTNLTSMVSSCEKPRTNKPDPVFHTEGNNSCLWELCALRCHYHPLVARWAQLLSANNQIQYTGDPLDDLSTNTFLSRFQNKQPATKHRGNQGKVKEMQPRRPTAPPVTFSFTIKDFQTKKEKDIRPDELFFFRYLHLKIATMEREDHLDEAKSKKKERKREKGKERGRGVSTEALQGLLEAEAEDGNFGMEGREVDDDEDEDDNEEGEGEGEDDGFGTFLGKRGAKRKGAPEKKAPPAAGKGKNDGNKGGKKRGKKGKKEGRKDKKGATKQQGKKKAKNVKKTTSKRQKTK